MSIRRLPEDVVGKIRSSAAITSLNGVVCGLLKNALDAGASKLIVYVDYRRGNCTVEDNGRGIIPGEFAEDGGLGRPHFTSKYPHDAGIHGRQGTFLASVAALSLTTITSHHHRYNSHNSISIHHGRVLKRQRPALSGERLETFDHGTRVAVHDLFGSMPVRVKHRATVFSDRAGVDKEWGRLVRDVVALLLAWPPGLSVSLQETKGHAGIRLKSTEAADLVQRTMRLFTQASLADSLDPGTWVPVSGVLGHVVIKGCVSSVPVATRRSQFISLGILPLVDEYGSNALYEEVNKVFKNSDFGVVEDNNVDAKVAQGNELKTRLRKGVDRWPMFYFRITLKGSAVPLDADDVTFRQRDLEDIISLLKGLSYGFLKKNNLRPQEVGVPAKESPFSVQTRRQSRASTRHQKPLTEIEGPYSRLITKNLMSGPSSQVASEWQKKGEFSRACDISNKGKTVETEEPAQPSEWLQSVLETWENPVFETTQPLLPQLNDESLASARGTVKHGSHQCRGGETGINFEAGSMKLRGRVTREALREAQVISQVDRKFILLKVPWQSVQGKPSSALVVLDQHAADERRRLEDLMAGYFTRRDHKTGWRAVAETLGKPMLFEVSRQEGQMLQGIKDHFVTWGVIYGVQSQTQPFFEEKKEGSCRVTVTALPPSILERCRSEPRLLVELIRREAWRLHDEGITPQSRLAATGNATHERIVSSFHDCPRGILELLHSRSCRSAIMFNDELSREECEGLVRDLARCTLPFQCAHGRPSMVPLIDLGSRGRPDEGKRDLAVWKGWMGDG